MKNEIHFSALFEIVPARIECSMFSRGHGIPKYEKICSETISKHMPFPVFSNFPIEIGQLICNQKPFIVSIFLRVIKWNDDFQLACRGKWLLAYWNTCWYTLNTPLHFWWHWLLTFTYHQHSNLGNWLQRGVLQRSQLLCVRYFLDVAMHPLSARRNTDLFDESIVQL